MGKELKAQRLIQDAEPGWQDYNNKAIEGIQQRKPIPYISGTKYRNQEYREGVAEFH